MKTIYFVQGIPTAYAQPHLFIFKTKNKAEKAKTMICDFYADMWFDYEYELKEVDITNLNIKDNMIYCVIGAVTPLETQTWVFDTEAEADAKEKELWNDPDRFIDAQFSTINIDLNDFDTIALIKDWIKEEKEFYDSL